MVYCIKSSNDQFMALLSAEGVAVNNLAFSTCIHLSYNYLDCQFIRRNGLRYVHNKNSFGSSTLSMHLKCKWNDFKVTYKNGLVY